MEKWFIGIGIIILICIAEWMREIFTFRITKYEISSVKLKKLTEEKRIIFLSDLHNQCYGKNNDKLIQAIREQQPELILVGGDMVVGKQNQSTNIAEEFVCELCNIAPVYYANGNHEFRMKIYHEDFGDTYHQYKQKLEMSGVRFLENESIEYDLSGITIVIHGLEIPREGYRKFGKAHLDFQEITERIPKPEGNEYHILMAHNPLFMDLYKRWGADLILSGHLHGGVVRIPGVGGVITPQFRLFPKYSGELTVEEKTSIVVTKGIGTHTIPIRFLNPAEIVVLQLKGKTS